MASFQDTPKRVEEILIKAKQVAKGKTLQEADIHSDRIQTYGVIARRCRDDREFSVKPYPCEQGFGVGAFTGGFFEHKEWPPRKHLEIRASMRPVSEYEANYVNAAGYWMSFHQAAIYLRTDSLEAKNDDEAEKYDVWASIAVRYGLRFVGFRTEFYKMAARDPVYAKMVLPTLQQRHEVAAADDLNDAMEKLDGHLTTQLMKAVATLAASNATKKAGKGGAAGKQ